MYNSEM